MGIKHLWTVFTPFCETKPLYELQGKKVAVDLSCWICEAQNITEYQIQPKMYLRNLYFRTCYLLLAGVNPVFILEGKAPEMKFNTIAARNAIQFKGAKPKASGTKGGKDRSRFNHVLKQCEEMLQFMGISCIKGKGEAESFCAYLNDMGLVDGCISQDSDCFAYGAKVVYRNFSIASQGAYSASGGAVDVYNIDKIYKELNFGRNKIIAMALLCGSDYNDGVVGIGKESALKLFENLKEEEVLNTLRSWRKDIEKYNKLEDLINNKNICTSCGHHGKLIGHNKNGCPICSTNKGCNDEFKEKRLKIKNELSMRSKALQDPNFPDEDLIEEFLIKKDQVSQLDLTWRKPDVTKFVLFTIKYLQWEKVYAMEKILPLLTRWQCLNYEALENQDLKDTLKPQCIKKIRKLKGVPSYEIIWADSEGYFKNLITDEEIEESNITLEKFWSTIEPEYLVSKAYPNLVEEYLQSKVKPKKRSKRKEKANNDDNESTPTSKPRPKKISKKKKTVDIESLEDSFKDLKVSKVLKPTLLDNFLKQGQKNNDILMNNCITSTPSKEKKIDNSFSEDDDDCEDLSLIIQSIVSKKPPVLSENLEIIKNVLSQENLDNEMQLKDMELIKKHNCSSFFITEPLENDLFEQTFNQLINIEENTDDSDISDNNELNKLLNEERNYKSYKIPEEDSFSDIFIPLVEKLKEQIKS